MDTSWVAETRASTSTATTNGPWSIESRQKLKLDQVGNYHIVKSIGRGNFATVKLAKHEIAKTKVAVKIVDKTTIEPENLIKIEREIEILKRLEHPHIVKLYEVMRSDRFIYIVTEYCSGGEMFETLVERGRIAEDEARRWFSQAVSALAYCHEMGVVHRDLKAENVLIDKNNDIRIIDFGFSNFQSAGHLLKTSCGSPPYAAPELLLANDYDGTKADIWSLGVLLYIMVTGGFPFPGDSIDKLKRAIFSGPFKIPYFVSVECSDLLRKMLVLTPAKRYNIQQVQQHRWLTTKCEDSLSASTNNLPNDHLLNTKISEKKKLSTTVLLFLQQHSKWAEEQIIEDVDKKNYDGPIYAAYELLCEKLRAATEDEVADQPRRGSRGSILSGKANVDPEPAAPTISAHHLAQLSLLSSAEYESDDSSASEMCDDSPCSSSRRKDNRQKISEAMPNNQNREQRRHTLCATEPLLPPELLAQLGGVAGLQAAAALQLQQTNIQALLGGQPPGLVHPYGGLLSGFSPLPINEHPTLHIPYMGERRASASEALFAAHLMSAQGAFPTGSESPTASGSGTNMGIEEEGRKYLNQHGSTKRNTVHGMASPIPSALSNQRHLRQIQITASQQSQLEKLYLQHIHKGGRHMSAGSDLFQIKQLQREFQQLGKLAAGGASPTHAHSLATDSSSFSLKCTPRISITDENNKLLGPPVGPSSSATFNPVAMFDQKANEVLYGSERPATVIGFTTNQAINSGASTPDQSHFRSESRGTTLICAAEPVEVVHEVKVFFDGKKIQYEESADEKDGCWINTPGIRLFIRPTEDRTHVELVLLQEFSERIAEELVYLLKNLDYI
ncbi:unnamed protein product, partial [Mesorhabditis belari]|uniref:Serine/threonine-protein kinase kin-29 n=1 Tax=Mesorhabditis belari TaxID=2138241 RepID=A0AAF3JB63_9BILA